jgi:ceramide glucosyltransferase
LVCNESLRASLAHRLRWERSSRCSRPAGYLGQIFMHALPLALLASAVAPTGPSAPILLLVAALALRALLAWSVSRSVLRDADFPRNFWLLPLQDVMSFAVWCWGLFGREIEWRGARFRVVKGGRLQPVSERRKKWQGAQVAR